MPKCELHDFPLKTYCSWCSKPLCSVCVSESGGRKYCRECLKKLRPFDEKPFFKVKPGAGVVVNRDDGLNEDEIRQIRKQMAEKFRNKSKPRFVMNR